MNLPKSEWVKNKRLQMTRIRHLKNDFIKTKATELANKMIVDEVIREMQTLGISRKIQESVVVKNVIVNSGGIMIRIFSEYFAEDGFDVALGREEGTDVYTGGKHWVRPRNKKALKWITGGKARFSRGHKVSGLPPLHTIEKVIERKTYDLQEKLNEEYKKWKGSILNS